MSRESSAIADKNSNQKILKIILFNVNGDEEKFSFFKS